MPRANKQGVGRASPPEDTRGSSLSGEMIAVRNPATGEIVGYAPDMGRAEAAAAIDRAVSALKAWHNLGAWGRAEILHRWADLLSQNKENLARTVTKEQGKPLPESRDEVDYGLSFFHWNAEEGKRLYGETIPSHKPDSRLFTIRQPIGVTAAITPWNWPLAMITRKVGAALGAGCPMIVKPAPETPLTAIALADLARKAGVPQGVFEVITGDAETVVPVLMQSQNVRAVSFTGSTRVGKILLEQGAATVKKMILELGGNAPFIICADADLDLAVSGAIAVKFEAAGQNCIGLNKCLVHDTLYEQVCARIVERSRSLKVGNGKDDGVDMGPLISAAAVARCHAQVMDALDKGAELLLGGQPIAGPGNFYEPTVLAGVTPEMAVSREEIFGPILPLAPFSSIDYAIHFANANDYGLGAYVYTHDINIIWRFLDELHAGLVGINAHSMTGPPVPFGGIKESGLGREGGSAGITEFTELKYACIGNIPSATL